MDHKLAYFSSADKVAHLAGVKVLLTTWDRSRCVNPRILICNTVCCSEAAPTFVPVLCNSTDSDVCAPCEISYRKKLRTVAREVLKVAKKDTTALLTLTAPGKQRHCLTHRYKDKDGKQRPSVKCNLSKPTCRECPCSTDETALTDKNRIGEWNLTAVARWNKFITDVRRSIPGLANLEYFKAVEPQSRGAIHLHIILLIDRPTVWRKEDQQLLITLALRHGFGHEVDLQWLGGGEDEKIKVARYVAKYVSKTNSNGKKAVIFPVQVVMIPWGGSHKAVPLYKAPQVYQNMFKKYRNRSWTCSRGWGLNIARVRLVQKFYISEGPEAAQELMDEYLDTVRRFQGQEPVSIII